MGIFMKTGSIYTDMIKPLEKLLYKKLFNRETSEWRWLDREQPHLRGVHERTEILQALSEMRKIVPLIAETVIRISLWKDTHIEKHDLTYYEKVNVTSLDFYFPQGVYIAFWQASVVSNQRECTEWSSVVKGEMTPEAFVELLKNKSHGRIPWISDVSETKQISKRPVGEALEGGTFVTGSLDTVPCVISHPGTGIHFSGSKEDAINFLLEELIRAKEGSRNTEPGHIFAIEPYNRAKHGDEIDILMDDKGTTQRFKIGEDGQPIFPKSEAKGTGADGVTEGFITPIQRRPVCVPRRQDVPGESLLIEV